jgi:hypothetical protein
MQAGLDLALLLVEADARITLLIGRDAAVAVGARRFGRALIVDSSGG